MTRCRPGARRVSPRWWPWASRTDCTTCASGPCHLRGSSRARGWRAANSGWGRIRYTWPMMGISGRRVQVQNSGLHGYGFSGKYAVAESFQLLMRIARRKLGLSGSERTPNPRRGAVARQRTVRNTEDYLCANPMRPIYTQDLCEALAVSASALHESFRMVFGMSPHRYLKLRRMGLVRAALLTRSGPWHSVKAAAYSNGFCHLGQFAQDYKATFGELPSATLARASTVH